MATAYHWLRTNRETNEHLDTLVQFRSRRCETVSDRRYGFAARCEAVAVPRRQLTLDFLGLCPRGGAPLIKGRP